MKMFHDEIRENSATKAFIKISVNKEVYGTPLTT
jgi:hypothetical protein